MFVKFEMFFLEGFIFMFMHAASRKRSQSQSLVMRLLIEHHKGAMLKKGSIIGASTYHQVKAQLEHRHAGMSHQLPGIYFSLGSHAESLVLRIFFNMIDM